MLTQDKRVASILIIKITQILNVCSNISLNRVHYIKLQSDITTVLCFVLNVACEHYLPIHTHINTDTTTIKEASLTEASQ